MKKVLSIDFDGVLAQGIEVKKKYAKKWFAVDLDDEQTKEKSFNAYMQEQNKNISYRELMHPLVQKHMDEYVIPPGAKETLQQLHKEGFDLHIVSSRNDHDFVYAKEFVETNYSGLITSMIHTNNVAKTEVLEKLQPLAHIDDDLFKLEEVKELGFDLVYFRQAENKHVAPTPEVKEVYSWYDIYVLCKKY